MADWYSNDQSNSSGVDARAYPDGLFIAGWYDSFVGIQGGFLTWDEIDALRKKAKRRCSFNPKPQERT